MQENCDIILFALFRWNSPFSSISIALAKEFAKKNRVFYINHPYSFKDLATANDLMKHSNGWLNTGYNKDEAVGDNFISVIPPLTLPINWLPQGNIYNTLARYNDRAVIKSIEQTIKDYDIKNYVYINCYDPLFAAKLPNHLKPAANIYFSVDDISQDHYTAKHGTIKEEEAIRNADITLVTSSELFKLKQPFTNNIFKLNNAADLSNFKKAIEIDYPRPEELKNVKGKVIGYIGNLDALRIDYHMLKKLAQKHQDKTLLLIGPINNTTCKEIGLDAMPNVIFTGGKRIEELPQYLRYIDCGIIPFICNTLTKSIYPLKINEYLSAGKPVVSTNFSEDISYFKEQIYLANNNDDFLKLIDTAINEDSEDKVEQRIALAQLNTWTARVDQFWEIVNNYLEKENSKKQQLV